MTKLIKFKKNNDTTLLPSSSVSIAGGGDVLSNLVEYSTQEKRIGTWIDGRALYKKTFSDVFNKSQYPLNIPGLRNIIHIYGTFQNGTVVDSGNGNAIFPIPCPRITYPTRFCDVFIRYSNFYFELGEDIKNSDYHFVLTIEYTKN